MSNQHKTANILFNFRTNNLYNFISQTNLIFMFKVSYKIVHKKLSVRMTYNRTDGALGGK
jgi:hypothetical protein